MDDSSRPGPTTPEVIYEDLPAGIVPAVIGWTIVLIVPTFFANLTAIGIGAAVLNWSWFRQPAHWTLVLTGACYLTWYLWWGIRRILSLTTEPPVHGKGSSHLAGCRHTALTGTSPGHVDSR